jgi:salicylate biosynthesis isochorismate synthase
MAHAKLLERCVTEGSGLPLPIATLALAFEDRAPGPSAWGNELPGAEAILPRRLWWREAKRAWVVDTIAVEPGTDASTVAHRLTRLVDEAVIAEDQGSGSTWRPLAERPFTDLVGDAVGLLRYGALRKVVLARAVDEKLPGRPESGHLVRRLREEADRQTTIYWQDLAGDTAFVGATPETLFDCDGNRLSTMALAGSRARGADRSDDRRLGNELQASTKERKEHNLVVEHIARVLEGRCHESDIPGHPQLRRLRRVQHLETPITALLADTDPFDLLSELHPTPAVCGLPTATAADYIRRHEGLHRGLYTGVLGWVGADQARFCVPLRGGLIGPDRARLFAGAGIVETSEPEAELAETELKLAPMRRALAL